MSISTDQNIPKIRFAVDRKGMASERGESGDAKDGGGHSQGGGWAPLMLGGSALSLFLALVTVWGPVSLVMVAPFVVIGLAGSMGLRSLGR